MPADFGECCCVSATSVAAECRNGWRILEIRGDFHKLIDVCRGIRDGSGASRHHNYRSANQTYESITVFHPTWLHETFARWAAANAGALLDPGSVPLPPCVCFSALRPLNARPRPPSRVAPAAEGLIVRLITCSIGVGNLNRRSRAGEQSHLRVGSGTGSFSFLVWRCLCRRYGGEATRQEECGAYNHRAPRLPGSVLVLAAVWRLWTLWRRRLLDPVYVLRLVSIIQAGTTRSRWAGR